MSKLALYLQQNNLRVWKILHKFDVVITTNDDLDSRFPILRVNPILEAEDILKMLDYLKHNIFRNESKSFSEIFLVLFRLIL